MFRKPNSWLYVKLHTHTKHKCWKNLAFFSRYDKFRKSDKKTAENGENPVDVADAVSEKSITEVNTPA